MEQIPKDLLIHTVELEEYKGRTPFGVEYEEKEELEDVLVQYKSYLKQDGNGKEINVKAIMFLDSVNTPKARKVKEESKVKHNGETMTVIGCNPVYAFDPEKPHHYEVELI